MLEWTNGMETLEKQSVVPPVHVLVGTDYILSNWYVEGLQKRMARLQDAPVEVDKYRFEEEGAGSALQACQTLSLFAEVSVILLENCTAFLSSNKAKHDTADLEAYLDNPVESKVLVITVAGDKWDERKKLTKLAKRHQVVNSNPPKDSEAVGILREQATHRGASISADVASELWRRTHSLSQAVQELDKLVAYAANRAIEVQDVRELVSPPLEDNVFSWIDGVVKGNIAQSFRVLADVQRAGYDTFALYSLIARQLRLMWYAKVLGGKGYSQQQIASKAGAHPYAVKVAMDQAKHTSTHRLETLLTVVADAEYSVKSGKRDAGQALEWVLMACSLAK